MRDDGGLGCSSRDGSGGGENPDVLEKQNSVNVLMSWMQSMRENDQNDGGVFVLFCFISQG